MRLLLVEDDPMVGAAVQRGLRDEGHVVDWVQDGIAAELALRDPAHEMVLLDLGLPRLGGIALLERLRREGNAVPVLVITARDAVGERIAGLDAGADDYLVKPFDLDELAARVRALARRPRAQAGPQLVHGRLVIDAAAHSVLLDGQPVRLSSREFAVLQALVEQGGKPLSRAQLEQRLYGWGEEVESNAVEVHIHALRRKLGSELILNLRGIGYFVPQDT